MLHQFFYARKRNENFRDMGDSLPDQYRHAGIAGDSRREFGEWPSLRANLVIAAVENQKIVICGVPFRSKLRLRLEKWASEGYHPG